MASACTADQTASRASDLRPSADRLPASPSQSIHVFVQWTSPSAVMPRCPRLQILSGSLTCFARSEAHRFGEPVDVHTFVERRNAGAQ
jgi:hypothetical protein